MAKKSPDGIHYRREEGRGLVFFWRIGREKSKDFPNQRICAEDFIAKYIERHPKHKELVYDKTWEEIFRIFGIQIMDR